MDEEKLIEEKTKKANIVKVSNDWASKQRAKMKAKMEADALAEKRIKKQRWLNYQEEQRKKVKDHDSVESYKLLQRSKGKS